MFDLLLFPLLTLKKIRHKHGYDSSFSKPGAKKSSRSKHSIFKYLGYKYHHQDNIDVSMA